MPDPEKELMLKIIKDDLRKFNERITELTQKIRDTKISNSAKMINQNKIIADYTLLKERIEKLEQWKKQHLDDLHKDILQPWLESHNTKIAELSKRMGDTFINQKVFFIKEIDKLKEYIDNHIKEIHTRSHNQANKIEKELASLREEIQNGDIMVLEPLMKDIVELKESLKAEHSYIYDVETWVENIDEVLQEDVTKAFDLILKRDTAISRNNNEFFGDGIFQQELAKHKNNIYRKLEGEKEKGVGKIPTDSYTETPTVDRRTSKPESKYKYYKDCSTCQHYDDDNYECESCINQYYYKEKEPSDSKNVVFPTKLTYEDEHPEDSEYKTPESVKFIKEFDFKKEEPSDDELEDDFIDSITGYREEMEIQRGLILLKRGELEKWYDIFLHDDQMKHLEALSEMEKCLEAKNDA